MPCSDYRGPCWADSLPTPQIFHPLNLQSNSLDLRSRWPQCPSGLVEQEAGPSIMVCCCRAARESTLWSPSPPRSSWLQRGTWYEGLYFQGQGQATWQVAGSWDPMGRWLWAQWPSPVDQQWWWEQPALGKCTGKITSVLQDSLKPACQMDWRRSWKVGCWWFFVFSFFKKNKSICSRGRKLAKDTSHKSGVPVA